MSKLFSFFSLVLSSLLGMFRLRLPLSPDGSDHYENHVYGAPVRGFCRRNQEGEIVGIDPDETQPAPGEIRYRHPRFGLYSIVETAAGPTGPIFHSREGFGAWELAGKPKLPAGDRPVSFGLHG